ncbi:MAG: BamA/TamA family outer membrane protein [Bacteroidales bacterium]|jgi:outer membrane protein assembly factor BamA|nr:BamA/TamA family outer membrane protein [Bacteroidales bacterium]MCI1786028.1 BamA/TamA family outer membrane protein [Bacteroidales bacterium]
MKRLYGITLAIIVSALLYSCSTTRTLQEGEYRLEKNETIVTNDKNFSESEILPYIKQQPNSYMFFGVNPFLDLYNWSGKGENKGIRKIIRKIGVAPVVYDPEEVDESVKNISGHLEYLGYYNSQVSGKVSVNKKKVAVSYIITLGKRYPISEIRYAVPQKGEFSSDFFADTAKNSIKPGSFLSESALEKESVLSSARMRNKGYFGFTKNYYFFEADTLSHPDSAILEIRINGYTRNEAKSNAHRLRKYYLGNVTIGHPANLKFKDKILKNLNTLTPGKQYREKDVNTTYSRFSSVKTFSSVNIAMTPTDTNHVDCAISLSQSPIKGFKANIEGSSNSTGLIGISPQVTLFNKNIFHGGEWLTIGFLGNFQFKPNSESHSEESGTSLSLSFPKFLGLPDSRFRGPSVPRTEVTASYNFQDRPEYTRNIISSSFGYNGNIGNRLFYQAYPIQINIVRLFNLDETFYNTLAKNPFMKNAYQNHFDAGSRTILYYTTNSDVNPMTSYYYWRLQTDLSGNVLSLFDKFMRKNSSGNEMIWNTPYSQYVRAEFSSGRTIRFGKDNKQAFAIRLLGGAGYAYGNSKALPFEKQFYSGGANSLRGWQARAVGPGTTVRDTAFSIPSQTGDMKLEANIEYRFPLFWKLSGAVFTDAGNVWTLTGDEESSRFKFGTFTRSIAADWGLGIRMDMNFILLRLDIGMKVHDPSAEGNKWVSPARWMHNDEYAVHFGVGYPF